MCERIERIRWGTRQNDGLETGLGGAYGREISLVILEGYSLVLVLVPVPVLVLAAGAARAGLRHRAAQHALVPETPQQAEASLYVSTRILG